MGAHGLSRTLAWGLVLCAGLGPSGPCARATAGSLWYRNDCPVALGQPGPRTRSALEVADQSSPGAQWTLVLGGVEPDGVRETHWRAFPAHGRRQAARRWVDGQVTWRAWGWLVVDDARGRRTVSWQARAGGHAASQDRIELGQQRRPWSGHLLGLPSSGLIAGAHGPDFESTTGFTKVALDRAMAAGVRDAAGRLSRAR